MFPPPCLSVMVITLKVPHLVVTGVSQQGQKVATVLVSRILSGNISYIKL